MTKIFRYIVLLIWFWISVFGISAQDNSKVFKRITVEDGLSQSSVMNIVQDSLGFIWFGTRDGLNRYEGNRFVIYRQDLADEGSLSNNFIHSIYVGNKGGLWVGTETGLNKYDFQKDRFSKIINPTDIGNIDANFIQAIKGKDDVIYVGTSKGLWVYNPSLDISYSMLYDPEDESTLSSNLVYTLLVCSNGDLVVGTDNGLNFLKEKDGVLYVYKKYLNEYLTKRNRDNEIRAIAEGENGHIWFGTYSGGLTYLDPSTGVMINYSHDLSDPESISNNRIHSLSIDEDSQLWVGTNNGLNIFQQDTKSFTRYFSNQNKNSLSHNSIKSIFVDRKGSKWIGTYYGGVNLVDDDLNQFTSHTTDHSPVNFSSNVVNSFIEDSLGNIWVGTDNGVDIFDLSSGKFTPTFNSTAHKELEEVTIKSMIKGERGEIWIGTYNQGLIKLDPQKAKTTWLRSDPNNLNSLSNNNVYSLLQENENTLWTGMHDGGLMRYEINTGMFQSFQPSELPGSISSKSTRSLFLDSKKQLWIGTENGGLNLFLAEENKFKVFTNDLQQANCISSNAVNAINEDADGHLWIGTGHGLNYFNQKTNTFIAFTNKDGLPSNNIVGILEDGEKNIWISTNNGLAKLKFDFTEDDIPKLVSVNSYDQWDGLPGNEFSYNAYYKTKKGYLLFGGFNGFVIVKPEELKPNNFVPPLVFTGFKVLNKKINAGDSKGILEKNINEPQTIILPYNKATFTVEFSILNYINPAKNIYKYKLDGLENDWNFATNQNSVSYTVQNPGNYTFQLMGANNDGVWNEEMRTLDIRILPPPWKSDLAFFIYFLLVGGVLFGIIRFIRMRSRLKYELRIEQLEKERQEELHQMKLRFFTNITHELRTPLTLIMGTLDRLIKSNPEDESLFQQLFRIQKNSDRLLKLINQLLVFRKVEIDHLKLDLEEVDIVQLLEEACLSFEGLAFSKGIQFDFKSEKEKIQASFDKDKIEGIFLNLLSNAFKFTGKNGMVSIEIALKGTSQNKYVEIVVADTGRGISEEDLPHIFERFYESNRINNQLATGTGIGLSLSKQMIELHHGSINVESRLNKGTRFFIKLPLQKTLPNLDSIPKPKALSWNLKQKESPSKAPILREVFEYKHTLSSKKTNVLIVEDNPEVKEFIKSIFQPHYEVFTAANGVDALKEAIKVLPDLIISDVMMPEMDGIELCKRIKSEIHTSHIPVLLLTAKTSPMNKLTGLDSGADDYITKPFLPDELLLKSRNIINSRRQLREKYSPKINLEPSEITFTSIDEHFLLDAIKAVERNMENPLFDTNKFASEMAVSRSVLFSKLKALINETPNNFTKTIRLKRAAQLFEQGKFKVSEVCYKVGFNDKKYFSKCFAKMYGQTPTKYMEAKRILNTKE